MTRRRVLQVGVVVWAWCGAAVALASVRSLNADARVLVAVASVVGPSLAILAARQLSRRADRLAGVFLLISALLTPTYFAYVINLPALLVGIALSAAPRDAVIEPAVWGTPADDAT